MYPYELFWGLTLYDLCTALGVLAALVVARVYAEKLKISAKLQNCGILTAVVSIILGFGFAALFQAFYNYLANPAAGFRFKGITFYGGLIGGAAVFLALWFTAVRKLCGQESLEAFHKVLGIAACSIAIAHCIGRVGCLMAGCCHGGVTDATNDWIGIRQHITVNGAKVYEKVVPTQLLEAVFLLELFLLFTYTLFRTECNGIALYMLLYGVFRFIIEYVRTDYRGSLLPGLTPSQAWSVALVAGGAAIFAVEFFLRRKKLRAAN